jgi:RimJ/RimL family protein N-acetyltransferase
MVPAVAVSENLSAQVIAVPGVVLTPLTVADAAAMATVLGDPGLYRWTGGSPPSVTGLEQQYHRQTRGPWPPDERWLNWVVRTDAAAPVGSVQATVTVSSEQAALAWVIGREYQRRGYGTVAAGAVTMWLADHGITVLVAHIRRGHLASEALASGLGFHPTGQRDPDGEQIWRLPLPSNGG